MLTDPSYPKNQLVVIVFSIVGAITLLFFGVIWYRKRNRSVVPDEANIFHPKSKTEPTKAFGLGSSVNVFKKSFNPQSNPGRNKQGAGAKSTFNVVRYFAFLYMN